MKAERDERIRLQVEIAAIKQHLADHVAVYQEADRRKWGLTTVLVAALLSLASGLIVALTKK